MADELVIKDYERLVKEFYSGNYDSLTIEQFRNALSLAKSDAVFIPQMCANCKFFKGNSTWRNHRNTGSCYLHSGPEPKKPSKHSQYSGGEGSTVEEFISNVRAYLSRRIKLSWGGDAAAKALADEEAMRAYAEVYVAYQRWLDDTRKRNVHESLVCPSWEQGPSVRIQYLAKLVKEINGTQ